MYLSEFTSCKQVYGKGGFCTCYLSFTRCTAVVGGIRASLENTGGLKSIAIFDLANHYKIYRFLFPRSNLLPPSLINTYINYSINIYFQTQKSVKEQ